MVWCPGYVHSRLMSTVFPQYVRYYTHMQNVDTYWRGEQSEGKRQAKLRESEPNMELHKHGLIASHSTYIAHPSVYVHGRGGREGKDGQSHSNDGTNSDHPGGGRGGG